MDNNVDKAFANILRYLRKKKGVSQEAFSFDAGLHRTYISQLERGLKSPSLRTLYQISQILGIPLSEIMKMIEEEMKNVHSY